MDTFSNIDQKSAFDGQLMKTLWNSNKQTFPKCNCTSCSSCFKLQVDLTPIFHLLNYDKKSTRFENLKTLSITACKQAQVSSL